MTIASCALVERMRAVIEAGDRKSQFDLGAMRVR